MLMKRGKLWVAVLLTLTLAFIFFTDLPSRLLGSYCSGHEPGTDSRLDAAKAGRSSDGADPSSLTTTIAREHGRPHGRGTAWREPPPKKSGTEREPPRKKSGTEREPPPKISGGKNPPRRTVGLSSNGLSYGNEGLVEAVRAPDPITQPMIRPCGSPDPLCTQYLSVEDRLRFGPCKDRCARVYNESSAQSLTDPSCRFLNGSTKRAPVALISFPGSGNTWARGLLEQATGICTGSVYCDVSLRASGMYGESVRSGSVLVVKTHHRLNMEWTTEKKLETGKNGDPKWSAAILIVRNPFEALVSEWNRHGVTNGTGNMHVTVHGPEHFGKNADWDRFVTFRSRHWKELIRNWYLSGHPVLVVRYADLKSDTLREVKRMLDFLNFPYTDEEVSKRMAATFDTFHRSSHREFEHYTPHQRAVVNRELRETIEFLREQNRGNILGIEKFLSD